MPLFPSEVTPDMQAAERVFVMRERGTRSLLLVTILVIVGWFAIGKIQDYFLLKQQWGPITFDEKGLTVIGALDGRGEYERNMFQVIQSNKSTRVELTEQGMGYCFTKDGPLFDEEIGGIIQGVITIDGKMGFSLLAPYLRAGIARFQQQPNANALVWEEMPIEVPGSAAKPETLKVLLQKYRDKAKTKEHDVNEEGVGSGAQGGGSIEHGLVIPGEVLVRACPVLLNTKSFTGGEVIVNPGSILNDTMYTVRLYLTPEGRSRFYRWSRDHSKENIVFVVNGEVKTAGRVSQPLDVSWWEISNIRDKETAEELVKVVQPSK